VRDLWACAHLKFLRDLFHEHKTPPECLMVRMLIRLEPVCLGETVEERMASLKEQLEREVIYTNHLQAQAALVTDTCDCCNCC
jgi:hypothetical protein